MKKLGITMLVLLFACVGHVWGQEPAIKAKTISAKKSPIRNLEHVVVYRHPKDKWNAAFPEITQMSDGELVCSFRETPYPATGHPNVSHSHGDPQGRGSIIRSKDGGKTWDMCTYRVLAGSFLLEQCSVSAVSGNLLLFAYCQLDSTEKATISYKKNDKVVWTDTDSLIKIANWARRSKDRGDTWDDPTPMFTFPMSSSPVHAPMLELPDGTLLSPNCGRIGLSRSKRHKLLFKHFIEQHPQCVIRSYDRGLTWGDGSIVALDPSGKRTYHQCSLVRMDDGEIIACMHSGENLSHPNGEFKAREVNAWLSRSDDDGRSWSPVEALPMRITGSATALTKLKDGRLLFVWSDRHIPSMRVAISEDRGKTWTDRNGFSIRDGIHIVDEGNFPQILTYDGSSFGGPYSDIGEPCTTQLSNGKIVTVYYWFISRENPIRYIEAAIYEIP